MRQIKFRIWHERGKRMLYDSSLAIKGNKVIEEIGFKVMQFIELYDKTNREIYEGDIVEFYIKEIQYVGKVVFERGAFIIACDEIEDSYVTFIEVDSDDLYIVDLKVIGNLCKNPELLNTTNRNKTS